MNDPKIYKKFNEIVDMRNHLNSRFAEKEERDRFIRVCDYCLNYLKDDYRLILQNSYFKKNYEFWWLDYFCKSSYYRKRFWAISGFVRLFEVIYENINDCSVCSSTFC